MEIFDDPRSTHVVLTFELPGVKTSDLCIRVEHGNLVLRGRRRPLFRQRRTPRSAPGDGTENSPNMDVDTDACIFPAQELRYGRFGRAVSLPKGVDASCLYAALHEGLLTIIWPRSAHSSVKQETPAVKLETDAMSPGVTSVALPTSAARTEDPRARSLHPSTQSAGKAGSSAGATPH
ncbi:unnamed protein product [Mycena citricolor]|uniref:SHSP domain-containing protein n=1 Tax=Mycena citricolor TaxID=2018698 RepID=A0AAD2GU99_9AGAR|nr:unnamed protein product [Mycena citricolor]